MLFPTTPVRAQAAGLFQTNITYNTGGSDIFWAGGLNPDGNVSFNNSTLGLFSAGGTLRLNGGQIKTFKNSGGDVTGAKLNYRVYRQGTTPGAFTEIDLPFDTNLAGAGDQLWTRATYKGNQANIDLLSGLTVRGRYVLEVYWRITTNLGDRFDSNFGSNYSATFDYLTGSLCGNYTINPGAALSALNFQSFTGAVTALNGGGVSCATTFNVVSGTTYTESNINITATGTAANPIVFQKSGGGANPLITAATGSTGADNAFFKLVGADYVTFNGIDLQENASNTTADARMEYGFALRRASATDGANNNTIRNSSITLNRANTNRTIGIGIEEKGATGSGVSATSTAGAQSNNVFASNTITWTGTASTADTYGFIVEGTSGTNIDTGNEIGQTGAGNTVTGFNAGSGGAGTGYAGITVVNENNLKIVGNTLTSATTNATGGAFQLINIRNGSGYGTYDILNNTITGDLTGTGNNQFAGIRNQAPMTTLNIRGNTLTLRYPNTTSGVCYPIFNESGVGTLNIGGSGVGEGNTIQNCSHVGSGAWYAIHISTSPTTALNVIGNLIQNNSKSGSGSFAAYYNNSSAIAAVTLSGNRVLNHSLTNTGTFVAAFYNNVNGSSGSPINVTNNDVRNLSSSGNVSNFYGYYNNGGGTSTTETISGNKFWNIRGTGGSNTSPVTGINTGSSNSHSIVSNSVRLLSSGTGEVRGITANFGNSGTSAISQDSVYSLSSGGTVTGIRAGETNTTSAYSVNRNIVFGLSSSGTNAVVTGVRLGGSTGAAWTVARNKVYNLEATGSNGTVVGMNTAGSGTTHTFTNNVIGDLRTTVSSGTRSVIGISSTSGNGSALYYNTIVLNVTGNANASFSSAAIYATASGFPALDLRNNIVVNNSTPGASGRSAALWFSSTSTAGLNAASNNNLYYAGTPGALNNIAYGGTAGTTYQTLAAYQAAVTPRETNSITDNPTFISTTGSSADFLRLNATTPTKAESGGVAVSGVTDEYDNTNVRTGYPQTATNGGGTAPDIGAYEDDMTPVAADLQALAFTSPATTGCIGTATQTVTVQVKNVGTTTLNFATNNLSVSGTGTNPAASVTNFGPVTVSTGTLAPNATLNVVLSTTYDMSTVGSYSFAATLTGGGDTYAANNAVTTTRTVAAPVAGTLATSVSSFCGSTPTSLTLTLTGAANGDVQFEQSIDGGANWTSVGTPQPATASVTQVVTGVSVTTRFRAVVSCGALTAATSNVVFATNTQPSQSITAPTALCEGSSFNIAVTGSGSSGTVTGSASPNVAIPDLSNSTTAVTQAGVSSTITLSGGGSATISASSVVAVTLNITHTFVADLDIFLVDPSGTRAMLLTADNGGAGVNFTNTVLRTGAATNITTIAAAGAPFTGTYGPQGGLSTAPVRTGAVSSGNYNAIIPANSLIGAAVNGGWTLRVFDDANSDIGSLVNWSLSITDANIPAYTHAITGPGTVGTLVYSGTASETGTVMVTGAPVGSNVYTITTTDPSGCARVSTRTVVINPTPTFTFSKTDVLCNGSSTGQFTITPVIGTSPFQYTIDNGLTFVGAAGPLTFSAKPAGTYNVFIKDANGCQAAAQVITIAEPAALTVSTSDTGVPCHNGTTTVTLVASGGVGPYEYSLNNGSSWFANGGVFTGISPNTYFPRVRDANSCTTPGSVSYVVVNPTIVSGSRTFTAITCNNANDGTITVSGTGGTGTLTYTVDNGTPQSNTTGSFSGLAPGTYTVTISDVNLCTTTLANVVLTNPTAVTASISASGATTFCQGGGVNLVASTADSYLWTPGGATTQQINATVSGTYFVTATIGGCTAVSNSIVVVASPRPTATVAASPATVCVGGNSTVTFTFTAGAAPFSYQYSINGGAPISGSTSASSFDVNLTGVTAATTVALTSLSDATCVGIAALPSVTVTPTSTTTWLGTTTDWYDAANWSVCVPSATISAVIPTGTANQPVIASGNAAVNNLDIQGAATLTVSVTGNLAVHGSFTVASANSYQPLAGTTSFVGSGAQTIPPANYVGLAVSGSVAKELGGNITVASTLDLTNGLIRLGNFDLLMSTSGASVTGADDAHFAVVDGSGRFGFAQVGTGGAGTVLFPIGTSTASTDYTPAELTNTGTQDTFFATVSNSIPQPPSGPIAGGPNVVKKTWDISELVAGGSAVTLTLAWNAANEGASFNRNLTGIAHFNGSVWEQPATYVPATSLGGSRYAVSRTGLTSFSPFAVEDGSGPLPVELASFTAVRKDRDALLRWTTATEKDNRGFAVQVSTTNGKDFRTLAFVNSQNPNSTSPLNYEFTDREAGKSGVRYYRLVQTDLDGTETATDVRTVLFDGKVPTAVSVVPNPFAQAFEVRVDAAVAGNAQLTLIDALGRTVLTQQLPVVAGNNRLTPQLPNSLAVGTYTLLTIVDGQQVRTRLVKE